MNIRVPKFAVVLGVVFLALATIAASCGSADSTESQAVQQQQQLYIQSQPAPAFDWSLERHLMIELYVSRNSAVSTFSLTWDPYRGKISWSCPSR